MGWVVEESYQKPTLLRREQLSKVTAGALPSDFIDGPEDQ